MQRATLLSLAATGFSKLKAANTADDKVTYTSKEKILWNGTYVAFELYQISLGEFLDPSKDSNYSINIVVKEYAAKDKYLSDKSKSFKYIRNGKPENDNGDTSFLYKELAEEKKDENKLPKKLHLIYRKGGDVISLEYEKNKYSEMQKQLPVSSDSDGCFLTTACTASRGLADDCEELQTLRKFRNQILQPTLAGGQLVENYYAIAPGLVIKINLLTNASEVWNEVYEQLVVPSKTLIDAGKNQKAIDHYKNYVLLLQDVFAK